MTACAVALALCAGSLWTAHTRAAEPQTYNVTLSHAEASTDGNGRVVLTAVADGAIRGTFTIAVTRDANGTITGGEWALNNSYTDKVAVDPNAPASPDPDGGERLVQNGMLKGSVASGTLAVNADGTLTTLSDVVLAVNSGTLTYATTTSGSGLLGGSSLGDRDASTGTLSIVF